MGGHRRYIGLLAGAGYAVLIPDSFARKGRLKSGDPKRHRGIAGAPFKRIMEMRLEEIRYATEQAGRFPWVDKENLFLMGHSQGGAAARYSGANLKAHIISGSICRGGLRVPAGTPILSIYSENDSWLRGRFPNGCWEEASKRRRSIEFHFSPGDAHNLSRNRRARFLILDFMERQRLRR
jgi:dienelactone hydrolase